VEVPPMSVPDGNEIKLLASKVEIFHEGVLRRIR
jgi:hypothetical protein